MTFGGNLASMQIDSLFYVLVGVPVLAMLASAMWAYGDARKRGKSPVLVALLVTFGAWPKGLIAWLVFRPGVGGPAKRFNLDDYRQQ